MISLDLHRPSRPSHKLRGRLLGAGGVLAAVLIATSASATSFSVTSLVTNSQTDLTAAGFGTAVTVDPVLVNPWGMARAPGGAWFMGDTGTEATMAGNSFGTSYTGAGVKVGPTVTIPEGMTPPNGPTGVVYNSSGTGFALPSGAPSQFIIDSLDGGISALAAGSSAAVHVAQGPTPAMGPPHSIYTGLAIGDVGATPYLYAANNGTGTVDVYNSSFQQVSLGTDAFVDTSVAAGLLPYNVQNLDGNIWVTYAIAGPPSAEAGLGSGAVAEFSSDGTLMRTFAQGGELSSPWALAIAPAGFGEYAGDVLVGNFSHDDDGQKDAFINIFSQSGTYLGVLKDGSGNPILLPGLWALEAGDGGLSGSASNLYFTAGINDEKDGLFGYISAAPEPSTWTLMIAGIGMIGAMLRLGRRQGALAG